MNSCIDEVKFVGNLTDKELHQKVIETCNQTQPFLEELATRGYKTSVYSYEPMSSCRKGYMYEYVVKCVKELK